MTCPACAGTGRAPVVVAIDEAGPLRVSMRCTHPSHSRQAAALHAFTARPHRKAQ